MTLSKKEARRRKFLRELKRLRKNQQSIEHVKPAQPVQWFEPPSNWELLVFLT